MAHAYTLAATGVARTVLAAGFAMLLAAGSAIAAGSESGEPPKRTKTSTECRNGQVWDERTSKCVDAKQGYFDDDTLYRAARELAYAGQYGNAISLLELAADRDDPRILNYLGFAHRKAGRLQLGLRYYQAALARDPDYLLARSYMGQALLNQGNIAAAVAQLNEIRDRGGADTYAYRALMAAFEGDTAYN